ncbi:hypothetical protein [Borrelia duttonii]|uniref:hypothetical protein n=1 Tax=Borrelia duttonii TaxID=40834 RepID=UPI0002E120BB
MHGETKANDISKLLEDSRQVVEESVLKLEENFQKVKNFLEEAIKKIVAKKNKKILIIMK